MSNELKWSHKPPEWVAIRDHHPFRIWRIVSPGRDGMFLLFGPGIPEEEPRRCDTLQAAMDWAQTCEDGLCGTAGVDSTTALSQALVKLINELMRVYLNLKPQATRNQLKRISELQCRIATLLGDLSEALDAQDRASQQAPSH